MYSLVGVRHIAAYRDFAYHLVAVPADSDQGCIAGFGRIVLVHTLPTFLLEMHDTIAAAVVWV